MLRGLIPRENPESDKINRAQTLETDAHLLFCFGFWLFEDLSMILQFSDEHLINNEDRHYFSYGYLRS